MKTIDDELEQKSRTFFKSMKEGTDGTEGIDGRHWRKEGTDGRHWRKEGADGRHWQKEGADGRHNKKLRISKFFKKNQEGGELPRKWRVTKIFLIPPSYSHCQETKFLPPILFP